MEKTWTNAHHLHFQQNVITKDEPSSEITKKNPTTLA